MAPQAKRAASRRRAKGVARLCRAATPGRDAMEAKRLLGEKIGGGA
jgi:hypothetical protein